MNPYSYLVGGLLQENLTPEKEQEKLNLCASEGWELVTVVARRHRGHDYVFFYLRRPQNGESTGQAPRFDTVFFNTRASPDDRRLQSDVVTPFKEPQPRIRFDTRRGIVTDKALTP